jgi:hypothetical protein
MDIIDNLMYASYASDVQRSIGILPPPAAPVAVPIVRPANRITSDYIDSFPSLPVIMRWAIK